TRALFTEELLAKIMPTLPADKRAQYVDPLHLAMLEFGIDTPPRQAAFLAAIAYESAELKFTVEPGDGKAYEGRRDLGNIHPGDGPRFKGRSPIQLTGRNNYKVYGQLLGIDLVAEPEKAAAPEVMFRLAGLFWQKGGGNELADTVEERPDFAFMLRKVFRISDHDASSDARYKLFERARRVLLNPQPSGDTQKLAAISQKPSGWGVEILKVNVNGTGTNSAVVAPGTVVPVIVAYSIADPKCPGCVDQIQVGLAAEATPAGCVYDGTPGTDPVTDKGAVYVTAPSEPGVYYIGFDRSQGYSCVADRWWSGWKDEPGAPARQRYIGIIEVK
ncbi:MAG TPA: glycoside hydrolase family 19 protein, partial [Pyrinomonadaceae bacterium]